MKILEIAQIQSGLNKFRLHIFVPKNNFILNREHYLDKGKKLNCALINPQYCLQYNIQIIHFSNYSTVLLDIKYISFQSSPRIVKSRTVISENLVRLLTDSKLSNFSNQSCIYIELENGIVLIGLTFWSSFVVL